MPVSPCIIIQKTTTISDTDEGFTMVAMPSTQPLFILRLSYVVFGLLKTRCHENCVHCEKFHAK